MDMSMGDDGSDKLPSKSFLKHLQQGRVLVNRLSTELFADRYSEAVFRLAIPASTMKLILQ